MCFLGITGASWGSTTRLQRNEGGRQELRKAAGMYVTTNSHIVRGLCYRAWMKCMRLPLPARRPKRRAGGWQELARWKARLLHKP